MTKDDIRQMFTHTFLQSNPNVINNLDLIMKCFSIYRLDIGQRKGVGVLAAILFGIFIDVFQ
jgi:hypothetical protein